jgi:hypothetical protein
MARRVGIWKYEQKNYFDNTLNTCIDKIQIQFLPLSSFPIFNLISEDLNTSGLFKAGDMALTLLTTGGETSYILAESVSDFFRKGTRDYKYLIGIELGSQRFWGTFNNSNVGYNHKTKRLSLQVGMIDYEAKEQISKSYTGMMSEEDKPVEQFFMSIFLPAGISRLIMSTGALNYSMLIGGSVGEYQVRWRLQRAGEWVGKVNVWQQMLELLLGWGLMFYINSYNEADVTSTDFPNFILNITYLAELGACATTPIIYEAQDLTLYNNLQWLLMLYRQFDPPAGYDSEPNVYHGAISNGKDLPIITDKFNLGYFIPTIQFAAPGFINHATIEPDRYSYVDHYPIPINELIKFNKNIDTRIMEMPLYYNTFPFQGYAPPFVTGMLENISLSRILTRPDFHNWKVEEFAIAQYKRYIGAVKRRKLLTVKFDDKTDYGLLKTITITDDEDTRDYYITEIRDLDISKKRAKLECIEI